MEFYIHYSDHLNFAIPISSLFERSLFRSPLYLPLSNLYELTQLLSEKVVYDWKDENSAAEEENSHDGAV